METFFSNIIVASIVLIALLIFVHELGHFLVGKLCKIGVETFSIGFGLSIFKFQYKETSYRIGIIPLGGYVKFYGMLDTEEVPEHIKGKEFYRASLWKRSLVVAAGPFFNIIAAILAYAILGYSGIHYPKPVIGDVVKNSVAYQAGLEPGDEILAINDNNIKSWNEIKTFISKSFNKPLSILIKRNNQKLQMKLVPEKEEYKDLVLGYKSTEGKIGITYNAVDTIITVMDSSSEAFKAGLRTSDVIIAIKHDEKWINVKFWYEVVNLIYKEIISSSHLYIKVKPSLDLSVQEKEYVINIPEAIRSVVSTRDKSYTYQDKKAFVEQLGLKDSELTIGKADDIHIRNLILVGDVLLSWNNVPLNSYYDLYKVHFYEKPQANLVFKRHDKTYSIMINLKPKEIYTATGNTTIYELPFEFLGNLKEHEYAVDYYSNPISAIYYGIKQTIYVSVIMVDGIWRLISGQISLKAIGGPIMIAKIAGDSAKAGWKAFTTTIALISINLAILNLLPIPILDGGHLFLYAIEAIRRKSISQKAIERFQIIGIAFIVFLVILSTYNDISRFGKAIVKFFIELFK